MKQNDLHQNYNITRSGIFSEDEASLSNQEFLPFISLSLLKLGKWNGATDAKFFVRWQHWPKWPQ